MIPLIRKQARGGETPSPKASRSTLQAIEAVLRAADRSLHSREIAKQIAATQCAKLSGSTPWKTVTARISEDIRAAGSDSIFMRTAHGLFALREWEFATEFEVKRRRLNPIDETIRVVPADRFRRLEAAASHGLLAKLSFETLIDASVEMPRREAEETDAFVQLIPTFVIRTGQKIWTYTRTKRLPEERLHHARCVSFGGHMEASDEMALFRGESIYRDSVLRELYEELAFSREPRIRYLGVLHLDGNLFERQHAGLIFDVVVSAKTRVASLEPGMHTDVRPMTLADLRQLAPTLDSWSQRLIQVLDGT